MPTVREFEHALRDVGCSRRVAKSIISRLYDDEEREAISVKDHDVDEAKGESDGQRDAVEALNGLIDNLTARQIEEVHGRGLDAQVERLRVDMAAAEADRAEAEERQKRLQERIARLQGS